MSNSPSKSRSKRAEALFNRADKDAEKCKWDSAFRLMLAAAKLGDLGAELNVGNYYADGKGVRKNRSLALYWYRRAYRRGNASAANNIGCLFRDEHDLKRSLAWFRRAVAFGDEEANLEIARHYLNHDVDPRKAVVYLKRVRHANWVTEAGAEEADCLLRRASKILETSVPPA